MAISKRDIIISSIVMIYLSVLLILVSAKVITNSLGTTISNTIIYFIICYLYTNRISSTKWRILMVASSLCLIIVILSIHLYQTPKTWDFISRIIAGINAVSMVAFVLLTFTNDLRNAVLFAAFVTDVILVFDNREESAQLYQISTVVVSIIAYVILSTLHIKHIWDRSWKVASIASIFVSTLVLGVLLRIFWYKKETLFVLIASINGCLSLGPWLWLMFSPKIKAWWQAYREQEILKDEQYNFLEIAGLTKRFTTKELEAATGNFQAPIGEGASGAVFKGTLPDGSSIAVKQIKWQPSGETEFKTEMTIIASRQHINLVPILEFCLSPRGDQCLFLQNGSLDTWLFTEDEKRSQLTWALRYQIAIDVAKVLAYLHHECHHRILHLDIKPANILLDRNFRELLSDFGIPKLIGKDQSSVMTKARGTAIIIILVGYLAPEMLMPNAISTKSDIYSYGMVLMELVGGRRNLTQVMDAEIHPKRSSYFPKILREKMMQGELMDVVDKSLVNNEEIREEVTVLARLALWCIQENPMLRPSMIEVIEMLEGRTPVHVPPESSMFMVNFLDVEPPRRTSEFKEDEAALMSMNNLSNFPSVWQMINSSKQFF